MRPARGLGVAGRWRALSTPSLLSRSFAGPRSRRRPAQSQRGAAVAASSDWDERAQSSRTRPSRARIALVFATGSQATPALLCSVSGDSAAASAWHESGGALVADPAAQVAVVGGVEPERDQQRASLRRRLHLLGVLPEHPRLLAERVSEHQLRPSRRSSRRLEARTRPVHPLGVTKSRGDVPTLFVR